MKKSDSIRKNLLVLSVIFVISSLSFINLDNNVFFGKTEIWNENAKLSKISGPIHIDGNLGWANAKTAGKCTGSGNYTDPYIIEDYVIDGSGSGWCIYIENSDVFFEIQNYTLYNAINDGIDLSHVSNGILINNNCSNNQGRGMDITYTYDTQIINNIVDNNGVYPTTGDGIALQVSRNVTVSFNNITRNDRGMFVHNNQNCTISKNRVVFTRDEAMLIDRCKNFIIKKNYISQNGNGIILGGFGDHDVDNCTNSENILNDNEIGGISLVRVSNHTFDSNIMTNCGISLSGTLREISSHAIDKTNLVNNKPVVFYKHEDNLRSNNFSNAGQVLLVNCSNVLVSNIEISSTSIGMSLSYCNFSTFTGITTNDNTVGIYLYRCNYSTISNGYANGNRDGIFLSECSNNILLDNNAINNEMHGIVLYYSENNELSGNCVNNNNRDGIYLIRSNFNEITSNTANYNARGSGIFLHISGNNIISGNMIRYNDIGIYLYGSEHSGGSNNNTVSGNLLFGNNECISEIFSEDNIITNNNCNYTGGDNLIHGFNLLVLIAAICIALLLLLKRKMNIKP